MENDSLLLDILLLDSFYFDIQLFASNPEDEGRTEEPTEKRKREAREEGNIPKSQDMVSAIVFLIVFWTLWIMAEFIYKTFQEFMVHSFQSINKPISFNDLTSSLLQFSWDFWKITGPTLLAAVLSGILVNVLQVGFSFSTKIIEPKMSRISFTFEKLREKVLFSKQMFFNLFLSIIKVVALGTIFFFIGKLHFAEIINMGNMGLGQGLSLMLSLIIKMFNATGIFLIAISIPDYFFKRKQYLDSIKMKKEEVKQELKETEGDPLIKSEIKAMYQKLLSRQNIRKTVPQASVVITNPTHFAVALKYEMGVHKAPYVIAKGEDDMALLIREIAFENDVPVIENPPLARQLYSLTQIGDYIPEEFFLVVGEILLKIGAIKTSA